MEALEELWPHFTGLFVFLLSAVTSAHVVLKKRDARAAIAWAGLIWLVPLIGACLYGILGINRIQRRAQLLHRDRERPVPPPPGLPSIPPEPLPEDPPLAPMVRLGDAIVRRPLLAGNRIEPLVDGDAAYPEMLAAIEAATRSVALCSFIFDDDPVGRRFVEALAAATRRGVAVRVLVDDMGARYSPRPINRALRRAGVRHARFLPTLAPARLPFMNLRNHRKILVADGRLGFTGGMNIRAGHALLERPRHPTHDLHFRVEGPVVGHLQEAFAEDWALATREVLDGDAWFPELSAVGPVRARGVTDGPDNDFETLRWIMLGALACARRTVRIVTPYFLPDSGLVSALAIAALRGVRVDVVLPERGNIPLVQWASDAQLWQVIQPGCRVWKTPPPFDHAKLMVVDGEWSLVGSANWDPRSLRLNFELDVECYDTPLAARLEALVDARIASARRVTLEEVDGRRMPIRLRDGMARLFSPYL